MRATKDEDDDDDKKMFNQKKVSEDEENEEEMFLNNQIKELTSLLTNDKNEFKEYMISDVQTKQEEVTETSADEEELESKDRKKVHEMSNTGVAESREERANIVIDNDSLKDLVNLVVRTIEDETKEKDSENTDKLQVREETKKISGSKDEEKKEVVESKESKENKEAKEQKKEVVETKVEVKKKDSSEKREMCNTRKKECIEKKEVIVADKKTSVHKEETTTTSKKEIDVKKVEDANEIRDLVNELLDGKNEEEREVFTKVLEKIFEKTKKAEEQKKNIK